MLEYGTTSGTTLPLVGSLACPNYEASYTNTGIESAVETFLQNPATIGWEPEYFSSSSWPSFPENGVGWEANSTLNLSSGSKRNAEALGDDKPRKRNLRSAKYDVIKFIDSETAKCKTAGLPLPEESYYSADIQAQILDVASDRSIENAQKLLLCIGSSQSVANLQAAIHSWRTQADIESWQLTRSPSNSATFNIIESINQDIVCLNLLRRYHILRLFEECKGCETPSSSGYVQFLGGINSASRKSGNPRNNAEAEVTAAMMKETFPHLQSGTREYTQKESSVKSLRQLGKRFHILTTHFGRGILAFIPYHDLPGHLDLGISDRT